MKIKLLKMFKLMMQLILKIKNNLYNQILFYGKYNKI
jgi:hypothetical protein